MINVLCNFFNLFYLTIRKHILFIHNRVFFYEFSHQPSINKFPYNKCIVLLIIIWSFFSFYNCCCYLLSKYGSQKVASIIFAVHKKKLSRYVYVVMVFMSCKYTLCSFLQMFCTTYYNIYIIIMSFLQLFY